MDNLIFTRKNVEERYASAALEMEPALCCPVDYDQKYLEKIPAEVIEKDYGCGDPSKWVRKGETVLDLGSGTGKICFIASQVIGSKGKVIGVDMTDDMLDVARRNAPVVAEKIGYSNVEFRKGRIQDLGLDLELLEKKLAANPISNATEFLKLDDLSKELRVKHPLIESKSIDVVVSNCVLNLVESSLKPELFREIFRVLKRGGRAVISDIVSDEPVPEAMQQDAELWSGCISGAMTEEGFLDAFEEAGFHAIEIVKFETDPWQTVDGIEFRSVTVQAYKGKLAGDEHNQAVIYNGPFKSVLDDDGHRYDRGVRTAVCDKTFQLLQSGSYAGQFSPIEPIVPVDINSAKPFARVGAQRRHPKETKGQDYDLTKEASNRAESGGCC